MSREQLAIIDQEIRNRPSMAGLDLTDVRKAFGGRMISNDGLPLPRAVEGSLGGVPVLYIGEETGETVVFHLHGGGYMLGRAAEMVRLSGAIGARARARVISVDYRLAPEHPFPAALDDALAAYRGLLDSGVPATRIAFAGESAGGGLVLATLLAARDAGLPLPSSAVVLSAWTDLTLASESLTSRVAVDPFMRREALASWAEDYLAGADAANPLISPVFADLHALPPLLIQVGSNEVMLDDSLRLAARAAADEVEVRLAVTPGASHVFQTYGVRSDEANRALDEIGAFIAARSSRSALRPR